MGTFKSLNEEPALLLNTGLSTFSPSSKCATSYFETQWPRRDYLAGLTNSLLVVMNKLKSQSYPSHRKGRRITFYLMTAFFILQTQVLLKKVNQPKPVWLTNYFKSPFSLSASNKYPACI